MIEDRHSNQQLIVLARSGKQGRDAVLKRLYLDAALRQSITSIVAKFGGNADDAEMIFTTTLMQFVKTVIKRPDFEPTSNLKAYLCGIAKFTWFKESRLKQKHQSDSIEDAVDLADVETPEKLLLHRHRVDLLHDLMAKLGKNCKEVLLHWANGYTMKEIAEQMQYKSDMMARKKKYKCFKELMAYVQQHPTIKDALR